LKTKLLEWLKANRSMLLPALFLGLTAAFFAWRAVTLSDWFHISVAAIYGLLTLLAIARKLPGAFQSNALNIGISLFFLDLVFAQLNLKEVGWALASARWWLLIPSLAALMAHLVVRIWRWQWLLKPMGDIPFGPAFRAGMIGIGGNMVLPARAGEFLRAYVIGRSTGISKVGAFATVVVERIFDGLTMLLVLLGFVLIFGVRDEQLQKVGIAGATFYILALVGVALFMAKRSWFENLISRILPENLSVKVLHLLDKFASGLESLRDPKQLGMVPLLSLLTWAFIPLSFWPVLLAFDFHVPVPFFAAVLMLPMLAFGLTIPGAPGGVGLFEWAGYLSLVISFQLIGAPLLTPEQKAVAAASVVLVHISQSVPEALLGLWAFFAEGLTTSDLQAGSRVAARKRQGSG